METGRAPFRGVRPASSFLPAAAWCVVGVTLCGFDVGGWGCVVLFFVAAAPGCGVVVVALPGCGALLWGVVVGCGVLFVNSIVCLFFMPVFCF